MLNNIIVKHRPNLIQRIKWVWMDIRKSPNTPVRVIASLFLLLGVLGELDGPLPYIPVVYEIYKDIAAELIGAGLAVFTIDYANERRAKREYEADLLRRIGSSINVVALSAIEEAKAQQWFIEGKLKGAKLRRANFENADFVTRSLHETPVFGWGEVSQGAKLEKAIFADSVVTEADFSSATLTKCDFRGANVVGAKFLSANCQDINFLGADVRGVDFTNANLDGAQFVGIRAQEAIGVPGRKYLTSARVDSNTIMPDGSRLNSISDLERFTNAQHPNFWRPSGDANGRLPFWAKSNDTND